MATEQLKIVIDADYKGQGDVNKASKGLKGLDDNAKKSSSSMQRLTGTLKANQTALLGAAGVIGAAGAALVKFGKESLDLANEQERVETQLTQTLESTGHAAGLTAQELKNMAGALQSVTTFGDEAIIGAQSLLLTFTNIGGQVMPDATETVLNMSQALGQDLKSSAVQLGKALNDPITGVSALSRVGVSFTETQKAQIKTMVEMNDVAGAQGIILAELNKEFGGQAQAAAETYEGKIQQMTNTFGDFQEVMGRSIQQNEGFIDSLSKVTTGLFTQAAGWETIDLAMKNGFKSGDEINQMLVDGQEAGKGQNEVLEELIVNYNNWVIEQEKAVIATESHDRALIGASTAMEGLNDAMTVMDLTSIAGDFGTLEEAEDRLAFAAAMARDRHVEASLAYEAAGNAADTAEEKIERMGQATKNAGDAANIAQDRVKLFADKMGKAELRARDAEKRVRALRTAMLELPAEKTIDIITNFISRGAGPNNQPGVTVPTNSGGGGGGSGVQERVININVTGGQVAGQTGELIAGRTADILGGLN